MESPTILSVRFMNCGKGKNNWTRKLKEYLDRNSYGGVTRMGTKLQREIL